MTLELDPDRLELLGTVSFYFCGIFLALSLVAAILLQGAHEVFRKSFNKFAIREWLKSRTYILPLYGMLKEMPAVGSGLFSLPYWQLTGQIGAVVGSQLNLAPSSHLILTFANIPDFNSFYEKTTGLAKGDSREAFVLREISARTQAGINSLHTYLRNAWNIFDYLGSLAIIISIASLLTTLKETQGQRFLLYTICFFAWFATPILRRMIERLVPFR